MVIAKEKLETLKDILLSVFILFFVILITLKTINTLDTSTDTFKISLFAMNMIGLALGFIYFFLNFKKSSHNDKMNLRRSIVSQMVKYIEEIEKEYLEITKSFNPQSSYSHQLNSIYLKGEKISQFMKIQKHVLGFQRNDIKPFILFYSLTSKQDPKKLFIDNRNNFYQLCANMRNVSWASMS